METHSIRTSMPGLDGLYERIEGHCNGVGPFGIAGFMPVMTGIKERILGLRQRANTAPARIEHPSLTKMRASARKR